MKLLILFGITIIGSAIGSESFSAPAKPLISGATKEETTSGFVDLSKTRIKRIFSKTSERSEGVGEESYRTPLLSSTHPPESLDVDISETATQIAQNALSNLEASITNRASMLTTIEGQTQGGSLCIQTFGGKSTNGILKTIPYQTNRIREGMAIYAAAEKLWDELRKTRTVSNNATLTFFGDLLPGAHVRILDNMRIPSEKVFVVRKVEGHAVFFEGLEQSQSANSVVKTIDPLEAVAIDVTLSNRWNKLEKDDPVLKAHLNEYFQRKNILPESHSLAGREVQTAVYNALLEKSDGYNLLVGVRQLLGAPLPSLLKQKSQNAVKDATASNAIFGIDEAVSMIETLQLVLREHCLPNCLALNYSNLMVQRSALLVHLLERYLLTSPIASPGNHRSELGGSILKAFNAKTWTPIEGIENNLQMQQQCLAGVLEELGWHGSNLGNLSCAPFWRNSHRRSALTGYTSTSHDEAEVLHATCNGSSKELLPKGLFQGCDEKCILAAARHHRNNYNSGKGSSRALRNRRSDRTGDVCGIALLIEIADALKLALRRFSGEDILQLDDKCAAALEAAKLFLDASQSARATTRIDDSQQSISTTKVNSTLSSDTTDLSDENLDEVGDIVLLEKSGGLKRRRKRQHGGAKYQLFESALSDEGGNFKNEGDTNGRGVVSGRGSASNHGDIPSEGYSSINHEGSEKQRMSSILSDKSTSQLALAFEATGKYCKELMKAGDLGNPLLLTASTHSDIRGYVDDTGAATESVKAQRRSSLKGRSGYSGLYKYLVCGFSGEMLPHLHAPAASLALQIYNHLRVKVEESKALPWELVVGVTSEGVFSASKYAKISSRLRKMAREFISDFLPCSAGTFQPSSILNKTQKSKVGLLRKLRHFGRRIRSKARVDEDVCNYSANIQQFSLMLIAWWVLGFPLGSNNDNGPVTVSDTLRGARLLFATFVFYRGDDPTAQAINLLDLYCGDAEFHPSEGWALLTTESKQNRKIRYKSIRSHIHVALQYIQASGDAMDTASWSAVTKISYLTASGCKAGGFDTEEKISGENGFAQVLRAYQCIKLQDQGVALLSQVFGKTNRTIAPQQLDQAFLFLKGVNRWRKPSSLLESIFNGFVETADAEKRTSILREWNGTQFPEVSCPWKSNSRSKFSMAQKATKYQARATLKHEYLEISKELHCTDREPLTLSDLLEASKEHSPDICLGHSAACIAEEFLWNP